jgi:hypothetical protein
MGRKGTRVTKKKGKDAAAVVPAQHDALEPDVSLIVIRADVEAKIRVLELEAGKAESSDASIVEASEHCIFGSAGQ